jgi:molecular chaperone GrpE
LAEIENIKKRFLKEREDNRLYSMQDFLKEFLIILDNLKRALGEERNMEAIQEGLKLIIKQIETLLGRYGVKEETSKEGDPFDPYFQEAISSEKSKGVSKPTILKVFQRGYFLYDRLLRPTLVHIALPEEGEENAENFGN